MPMTRDAGRDGAISDTAEVSPAIVRFPPSSAVATA